jgi:glycosyltransferase involved in cell wall biosynthesis
MISRLIRVFLMSKPDIVHLYAKVSTLGRIAAKIAAVKIVICNEVDLDGFGPDIGMKVVAWIKRRLEFFADKIISCSTTVEDHWRSKNKKKYCVINLPVDFAKFKKINFKSEIKKYKNGDYPVIGMVSRLQPGKGHEYLIRALPDILNDYPDLKVKIVGKGILLNDLRTLSKQLNVSNNIEFTGYVKDIYAELSTMDIFILPSLSEGFPISILEAMAAGLPVAASNVGGIPEIVENGINGFLFEPKDIEAIAKVLKSFFLNYERTLEMGRLGRQKIISNFSPEKYIQKLDLLYGELMCC